jgi:hypothetical protein
MSLPFKVDEALRLKVWAVYKHHSHSGIGANYVDSGKWPHVEVEAARVYEAEGCERVEYDVGRAKWSINGGKSCTSAVSATMNASMSTHDDDTHYPHILALRDAKPTLRRLTDAEAMQIVEECKALIGGAA